MRLTINLEDDLYAMARAHSVAERISISKAVNALLRLNNASQPPTSPATETGNKETCGLHPISGFPVSITASQTMPADAVNTLDNEQDERSYHVKP
ncbi:MAG: hypothetical protein QM496_21040 [Verrucomicrobiota bacterium]